MSKAARNNRSAGGSAVRRLFVREASAGRIHSMERDGLHVRERSAGSVYFADLDGKNGRNLLGALGNRTGIASAEI